MKTKIPFAFAFVLLIISCVTVKPTSLVNTQELGNPPGTKKIADDLYMDQEEIRNLDYLEFLHWNQSVYGMNSEEYKTLLPDPAQWSKVNNKYVSLDTSYSKHSEYRLFPVLGVSNKQARLFSQWRSDRVMEFILIRYKVLKYRATVSKDSIFTIEKYFKGDYCNVKPNPYLRFYPQYTLLDPGKNTTTGFRNICTFKKWE